MEYTLSCRAKSKSPMEEPKDELNWFGEGFDGFPKRLPEDCVEYTLHIIDSKLQDAAIRTRLREVQRAATELTKKLLKEYIWQRESFGLVLERQNGKVGLSLYSLLTWV